MSVFRIDRQPDTPPPLIVLIGFAMARLNKCLQLRTVTVAAHDTHSFAITPIEFAVSFIEDDLLRCMGFSLRDDRLPVLAVDVGTLDRSVV